MVQFDGGGWLYFPNAADYEKCYKLANPLECSGRKYFAFLFSKDKGLETYKWSYDGKRSTLLGITVNGHSASFACSKEIPKY